jgi:enoyl-CoA hydratase
MAVPSSTESPLVLFERIGPIALITLNRPNAHNALNAELVVKLLGAWETVRDDPQIRVAVITGSGAQSFCAGGDLAELIPLFTGIRNPQSEWEQVVARDLCLIELALLRTFDTGKPVIAAVNGSAIAGGMELMMGTDIRVVADHALFGLPEVKHGVFAGGGSTVRLPRQIPYAIAMELLLTGDLIDASRALELGLVNYKVPADQVLEKAMTIAARIAANAPISVRETRSSVRECLGVEEKVAMLMEHQFAKKVLASADAQEGPRAFKEKRKPCFTGG